MGYCLVSIPRKSSRFLKDLRRSVEKYPSISSRLSSFIIFTRYLRASCVPSMLTIINSYRMKIALQIEQNMYGSMFSPCTVWHLYWINGGPLPVARQS